MNGLKIYSQNWLDENCAITCLSGDALKAYLYDQNQETKYSSSGSDDATEETIEIIFKNWQGTEISRTFDRIIMLNHNVKSGGADYWNGSAWVAIPEAAMTAETTAYKYVSVASAISASRVRMRLSTTQTANAQKFIGELKFCLSILDGTQLWRSSLPRQDEQRSGYERTGDGRLVFYREWTKFAASGQLYDVAKADHDLLLPYMKAAEFITIVFYEDHAPEDCFECAIVNAPRRDINRKTGLYEISLELQER